jgi:NDP-sugar pyrophosphorylase family protein
LSRRDKVAGALRRFPVDILILCGGQATRLGTLAAARPKVLMDVNGRPFLDYLLGFYGPHFDRIFLLAGYLGEQLMPYASAKVEVVIESTRLDTGGAILNVLDRVSSRFAVANGDTLFVGLDLDSFLTAAGESPATIAVVHGPTGGRGCVALEGRRVQRFVEKEGPPEGFVYAGLAAFERRVLSGYGRGCVSLEREIFPKLAADGFLDAWRFAGRLYDIGTPQGLDVFRELLSESAD